MLSRHSIPDSEISKLAKRYMIVEKDHIAKLADMLLVSINAYHWNKEVIDDLPDKKSVLHEIQAVENAARKLDKAISELSTVAGNWIWNHDKETQEVAEKHREAIRLGMVQSDSIDAPHHQKIILTRVGSNNIHVNWLKPQALAKAAKIIESYAHEAHAGFKELKTTIKGNGRQKSNARQLIAGNIIKFWKRDLGREFKVARGDGNTALNDATAFCIDTMQLIDIKITVSQCFTEMERKRD